jgi:hypothetical protein
MSFLLERDSINGKDGKAFIQRNGQNIELFHLKKLTANGEFQSSDFNVVGTRIIQSKTSGIKYNGSMTVYYGSPVFLQMLQEYQANRSIPYFNIMVVNNDTSSTVGKQTVVLENCKFSGTVPIAMLDDSQDALQEDIAFTYTSFRTINEFNDPESYGGTPGSDGTDFNTEGLPGTNP